ncbi:MAG: hypothetical protein ACKVOK_15930 [Flavobacteriales bacterium]
MGDSGKSAWHIVSILITFIGIVVSLLKPNTSSFNASDYYNNKPYKYPEKVDDNLEEAMAKLNEKKTILPKDILLDTSTTTLDSGRIEFYQIIPYSEKKELLNVHNQIKTALKLQIEEFVSVYPGIASKKKKSLITKIEVVPEKLYRSDYALSYVMKFTIDSKMDLYKGPYYSIFNFDLRTKKPIEFNDFFEFGKTKNDGEFLEILTGKKHWYESHDIKNLRDVAFFFNKENVIFNFEEGQYPFTNEPAKKVSVRIAKLKNFIRAKYYPQSAS